MQNPRREIAIGIGVRRRESDTSLLGKDFPLLPLADARGRSRVAALRLFQDFTQRGERCLGGAIAVHSGSGSIWRYGEQQRPLQSIFVLARSIAVRAVVGSQEADGGAIGGAVGATVSFCRSNNSV